MRKFLIIAALVAATPALAAELGLGTQLGTTVASVTASLTDMGYEVRKAEAEDGKVEVYFVGENVLGEVYVDETTGEVVKIEMK